MHKIFIVMATYNGALFLEQQLLSIQKQTLTDWQLFIRDDGSDDNTQEILNAFSEQDSRINLLESNKEGNSSPAKNFATLLEYVAPKQPDYVFLSDQDDVWLPNKLHVFIRYAETLALSSKRPLLIHSDLKVVDSSLSMLSSSFIKSQYLPSTSNKLMETLLVQNFVTGCATMINGMLLKEVLPIRDKCIMHDWWLALVAAEKGDIYFIEEPSVLYRQHDKNSIGAKSFVNNLLTIFSQDNFTHSSRLLKQGKALKLHFDEQHYRSEKLERFISIHQYKSRFKRLILMKKYGFVPRGKLHFLSYCFRQLLSRHFR